MAYFTNEQIDEIARRIPAFSQTIKDTQFPLGADLDGSETIALVQNNANVRYPLTVFLNDLKDLQTNPIANVSNDGLGGTTTFASLAAAIAAVPVAQRITGLVLVFYLSTGWQFYQFRGTNVSQFTTTSNWYNLVPTSLPPSGTAGGSLTGTYPNPTLASNTVGTTQLSDGSVTDAKIVGMNGSKLVAGSVAQAAINAAVKVASPANLTITVDGTSTIYDGSTARSININTGGSLSTLTMTNAAGTSTTYNGSATAAFTAVPDGSITNAKIASGISGDKLTNATVEREKLNTQTQNVINTQARDLGISVITNTVVNLTTDFDTALVTLGSTITAQTAYVKTYYLQTAGAVTFNVDSGSAINISQGALDLGYMTRNALISAVAVAAIDKIRIVSVIRYVQTTSESYYAINIEQYV